jgi:hypothetical protein
MRLFCVSSLLVFDSFQSYGITCCNLQNSGISKNVCKVRLDFASYELEPRPVIVDARDFRIDPTER